MNINFELYRIFYVVANHCNITKASEELNISQPAISKSIKKLEEQLGGNLFVRTKKGVVLTSEGKEFYSYISKAIDYIYSAENKFTDLMNLETGHIRIGASTTLTYNYLAPFLQQFHILYPNIVIEIDTSVVDVLIQKLKSGLLDIIFFNITDDHYDADLSVIPCIKVHNKFITGEKYHFLSNQILSLHDINNYPLILQSKSSSIRRGLDNFLKEQKVELKSSMELAGHHLVTLFVKLDFGIGYIPEEFILEELRKKELFILNLNQELPSHWIGMATSLNHVPNFSTKKLMELISK